MITALILAGGLGSRLSGVVKDVPKPMAPINQRPFLEYLIDYWISQGVTEFIISVGHMKDSIINHFGNSWRTSHIRYVSEDTPLGTGGPLFLASEYLPREEFFLVLNGDTFFEVNLVNLLAFGREKEADCCFSLLKNDDKKSRYMCVERLCSGQINAIGSNDIKDRRYVNGGVYLMRKQLFDMENFVLGENYSLEKDILPSALAAQKKIYGMEFPGKFIDIGTPDDFNKAANFLSDFVRN